MFTSSGHLTYCTNIHVGESWPDHFAALKNNFPAIKAKLSPNNPMGVGLRISNESSIELIKEERLLEFKEWLAQQDSYVCIINGFPYGGFHHTTVKDNVHAPDWTTNEREQYTIRLFNILSALIPQSLDGGVSTSPVSYRLWFKDKEQLNKARATGTKHIIEVISYLINIHESTGKLLHLDIEPEPDGLLETGNEFIEWFENDLLSIGLPILQKRFDISMEQAEDLIKQHLRLCYDICHFAIGYEQHKIIMEELAIRGIKIGRIQISAALKGKIGSLENESVISKQSFKIFNEPTYLHQVVGKTLDGKLLRYPDLPEALIDNKSTDFQEWRAHFHVPIFTEKFGLLSSTQDEIMEVLSLQKIKPFTQQLEVETYTWEVLPPELKLPLQDSIIRELQWVQQILNK